jgi:hypothetical protein
VTRRRGVAASVGKRREVGMRRCWEEERGAPQVDAVGRREARDASRSRREERCGWMQWGGEG